MRTRYLPVFILCFGFFIETLSAPTGVVLSGRVLVMESEGGAPLAEAKVELLAPGEGKIIYVVYTDRNGGYAFRNVATGSYDLRVSYGRPLLQAIEPPAKTRRISLTASKELTITVRPI